MYAWGVHSFFAVLLKKIECMRSNRIHSTLMYICACMGIKFCICVRFLYSSHSCYCVCFRNCYCRCSTTNRICKPMFSEAKIENLIWRWMRIKIGKIGNIARKKIHTYTEVNIIAIYSIQTYSNLNTWKI